ncbi:MAG: hypothetical protein K2Y28_14220 [Burkholderiaceae bacterium]|nr:hypothetical protein [Burkholderiaceae bacterium]
MMKVSAVLARIYARLRFLFPAPNFAPRDFPFGSQEIAKLHRVTCDETAATIDDTTWKDMLIDEYIVRLSHKTSIFGQQILHNRLRTGLCDTDNDALGRRLGILMADPKKLEELRLCCRSLRDSEQEIAGLLFEDQRPVEPVWVRHTWLLPIMLIGSIFLAFTWPLAWLLTGMVMYLIISLQIRYTDLLETWAGKLHSLQMLLRAASLLGVGNHMLMNEFAKNRVHASKLNRSLTRSPLLSAIPGSREYANWFLLANITHYFRTAKIVFENDKFLRQCYFDVANVEADIALAFHLLESGVWCRVTKRDVSSLKFEQVVHPFLLIPAPLSIELQQRGAFITGQNGIGKSTLLRTVGLNLLVARAFGFCYAQVASLPATSVFSSMQTEDSLLGGESLYIAELRRAKELLAAAHGPHGGIYIIDEIFRGTNHLESVSAAAAVLDQLAQKGLVIVSSHNLILGALLKQRLVPLCVSAPVEDRSQLHLKHGVLETTNGIALLAERGFDASISNNAARVHAWLGKYLAHPSDCDEIFK